MKERKSDAMGQLRAELEIERKKRKLVEAQLVQLLELLEPHLSMTGKDSRAAGRV